MLLKTLFLGKLEEEEEVGYATNIVQVLFNCYLIFNILKIWTNLFYFPQVKRGRREGGAELRDQENGDNAVASSNKIFIVLLQYHE